MINIYCKVSHLVIKNNYYSSKFLSEDFFLYLVCLIWHTNYHTNNIIYDEKRMASNVNTVLRAFQQNTTSKTRKLFFDHSGIFNAMAKAGSTPEPSVSTYGTYVLYWSR